jgi:hypothetical protein
MRGFLCRLAVWFGGSLESELEEWPENGWMMRRYKARYVKLGRLRIYL